MLRYGHLTVMLLLTASLTQATTPVEDAHAKDALDADVALLPRTIPPYVPTEGKIWPLPQSQIHGEVLFTIDPTKFSFNVTDNDCPMLQRAIERTMALIQEYKAAVQSSGGSIKSTDGELTSVNVSLSHPCEDLPYLYMDESYQITIGADTSAVSGSISSASVWGVMLGLQSFTHLLLRSGPLLTVHHITVQDQPRFPFRGFMIDTSRHYLPVSTIKQMIDLMSMNKFNVLHWHIVDADSFPYQSTQFPDISTKGAWTPQHVYTPAQMSQVLEYATDRGIRVMAEFDTPGHTDSWGPGQPGLLTPCYVNGTPNGEYGPVDPTKDSNYEFLTQLFTEVTAQFPDHFLHLGGDEVPFTCWMSNPDIVEFIAANNLVNARGLEDYYFSRLLPLVSGLPTNNGYIVWQEVFDNNVALANDTIVHIWKNEGNPTEFNKEIQAVTAAGYQALLSSCWYLNYISYGEDWHKYYECDPQGFNGTDAQKKLMIGGEACMWGEFVDRTNIIQHSWPRGAVVAERLWSDAAQTSDIAFAGPRLEEQRQRMYNRGYQVEPLRPSYSDADLD